METIALSTRWTSPTSSKRSRSLFDMTTSLQTLRNKKEPCGHLHQGSDAISESSTVKMARALFLVYFRWRWCKSDTPGGGGSSRHHSRLFLTGSVAQPMSAVDTNIRRSASMYAGTHAMNPHLQRFIYLLIGEARVEHFPLRLSHTFTTY